MYVHSDTCSCITELYEKVVSFRGFSPKLGFFAGFFLYIINFAGRISEAAIGGAGARSALFCGLMSLKRPMCAVYGRACAATTH
jgi:hypothetical protein